MLRERFYKVCRAFPDTVVSTGAAFRKAIRAEVPTGLDGLRGCLVNRFVSETQPTG